MIWRIRSRKVFARIRAQGVRARRGPVRLTFLALPTDHPQVAFALGRRFGSAVERNRARRRLRSAFVEAWEPGRSPIGAFQLTGSRGLLTIDYPGLVSSLESCFAEVAQASPPAGPEAGNR